MGFAQWSQRRFGLSFETTLAAVPGWAPIGQEASWYRAHIDPTTRDLHLHPGVLAETQHHHQLRWPHIERYDDFVSFLHFEEFDPDEWAGLARDAGAGYALMVAKHHDGLCWWDAPGTDRTTEHDGPRTNVLGRFAEACDRMGLTFGAIYSLLDWSDDRYPNAAYVSEVVHPHVLDLVTRYGIQLLWGSGNWGAGSDHWRSDELIAAARCHNPDLAVNDRWSDVPGVATREYALPDDIMAGPWEFRRPLGTSAALNRAEPPEALMSSKQIVALLTEVVAKGGHLRLQVGPDAAGRIPDDHADRLRAAGGWIRRHHDLVGRGVPWQTWGDADSRLIELDGQLFAVDVSGQGRFAPLTPDRGKVTAIDDADGTPAHFDQGADGVRLARPPRRAQRLPTVFRVTLEPPPPPPIELFPVPDREPIDLAPLLADAVPGAIVQLGDGLYRGPARVPPGVRLRGLGPHRTTITVGRGAVIAVGDDARLAHCSVTGAGRIGRLPQVLVELDGAGATALGCIVDGHVSVTRSGGRVTSCTLAGIVANGVDHVEVSRSTLHGMGADLGVDITGGSNHLIDSCQFSGHLAAITLTGAIGSAVSRNRLTARWWGIRLVDTEAVQVAANAIEHTMRAVDVDGGADAVVSGNAVADGDSGCLLQQGTSNAEVTGNYWERCRVGLMAWSAGEFREHRNTTSDLGDPSGRLVAGP